MLFLKQPFFFTFVCHKSATTCQIDSNKVSNSKLKPELCNCAITEMTESTAPPQHSKNRHNIFLEHPVQREQIKGDSKGSTEQQGKL